MFDLRRRSTLHGGTSTTDGDDSDFGVQSSKIMFKNCRPESDRRLPLENVTVTIHHVYCVT